MEDPEGGVLVEDDGEDPEVSSLDFDTLCLLPTRGVSPWNRERQTHVRPIGTSTFGPEVPLRVRRFENYFTLGPNSRGGVSNVTFDERGVPVKGIGEEGRSLLLRTSPPESG